jgi:hypothetical protein
MPSLNEAVPFWFILATVGMIFVLIFIAIFIIKKKKETM